MKPLSVLLVMCSIFVSMSVSAGSVAERVSVAQKHFDEMLQKTPNKNVVAIAFFTNDMSLDRIQNVLKGSPLEVKGFHHGTQSYSGGYTFKPGETVDEAVQNYRQSHMFFLQKRMEIDDGLLQVESDKGLRRAVETHRKESVQMKKDFDETGLRIVGVELAGKVRNINSFKEKHGFVRVIEVRNTAKPQSAILPQSSKLKGEIR